MKANLHRGSRKIFSESAMKEEGGGGGGGGGSIFFKKMEGLVK